MGGGLDQPLLLTNGAVGTDQTQQKHEEWRRMDTGQENLTQAEKEKKNHQTPPKCRTAHLLPLLPGQMVVKPKVEMRRFTKRKTTAAVLSKK